MKNKYKFSVTFIFSFIQNGFSHSVNRFWSFIFPLLKSDILEHFFPSSSLIQLFCLFNQLLLMLNIWLFSLFKLLLFSLQKLFYLNPTSFLSCLLLFVLFILQIMQNVQLFIWGFIEFFLITHESFASLNHRYPRYWSIRNWWQDWNCKHFERLKYG